MTFNGPNTELDADLTGLPVNSAPIGQGFQQPDLNREDSLFNTFLIWALSNSIRRAMTSTAALRTAADPETVAKPEINTTTLPGAPAEVGAASPLEAASPLGEDFTASSSVGAPDSFSSAGADLETDVVETDANIAAEGEDIPDNEMAEIFANAQLTRSNGLRVRLSDGTWFEDTLDTSFFGAELDGERDIRNAEEGSDFARSYEAASRIVWESLGGDLEGTRNDRNLSSLQAFFLTESQNISDLEGEDWRDIGQDIMTRFNMNTVATASIASHILSLPEDDPARTAFLYLMEVNAHTRVLQWDTAGRFVAGTFFGGHVTGLDSWEHRAVTGGGAAINVAITATTLGSGTAARSAGTQGLRIALAQAVRSGSREVVVDGATTITRGAARRQILGANIDASRGLIVRNMAAGGILGGVTGYNFDAARQGAMGATFETLDTTSARRSALFGTVIGGGLGGTMSILPGAWNSHVSPRFTPNSAINSSIRQLNNNASRAIRQGDMVEADLNLTAAAEALSREAAENTGSTRALGRLQVQSDSLLDRRYGRLNTSEWTPEQITAYTDLSPSERLAFRNDLAAAGDDGVDAVMARITPEADDVTPTNATPEVDAPANAPRIGENLEGDEYRAFREFWETIPPHQRESITTAIRGANSDLADARAEDLMPHIFRGVRGNDEDAVLTTVRRIDVENAMREADVVIPEQTAQQAGIRDISGDLIRRPSQNTGDSIAATTARAIDDAATDGDVISLQRARELSESQNVIEDASTRLRADMDHFADDFTAVQFGRTTWNEFLSLLDDTNPQAARYFRDLEAVAPERVATITRALETETPIEIPTTYYRDLEFNPVLTVRQIDDLPPAGAARASFDNPTAMAAAGRSSSESVEVSANLLNLLRARRENPDTAASREAIEQLSPDEQRIYQQVVAENANGDDIILSGRAPRTMLDDGADTPNTGTTASAADEAAPEPSPTPRAADDAADDATASAAAREAGESQPSQNKYGRSGRVRSGAERVALPEPSGDTYRPKSLPFGFIRRFFTPRQLRAHKIRGMMEKIADDLKPHLSRLFEGDDSAIKQLDDIVAEINDLDPNNPNYAAQLADLQDRLGQLGQRVDEELEGLGQTADGHLGRLATEAHVSDRTERQGFISLFRRMTGKGRRWDNTGSAHILADHQIQAAARYVEGARAAGQSLRTLISDIEGELATNGRVAQNNITALEELTEHGRAQAYVADMHNMRSGPNALAWYRRQGLVRSVEEGLYHSPERIHQYANSGIGNTENIVLAQILPSDIIMQSGQTESAAGSIRKGFYNAISTLLENGGHHEALWALEMRFLRAMHEMSDGTGRVAAIPTDPDLFIKELLDFTYGNGNPGSSPVTAEMVDAMGRTATDRGYDPSSARLVLSNGDQELEHFLNMLRQLHTDAIKDPQGGGNRIANSRYATLNGSREVHQRYKERNDGFFTRVPYGGTRDALWSPAQNDFTTRYQAFSFLTSLVGAGPIRRSSTEVIGPQEWFRLLPRWTRSAVDNEGRIITGEGASRSINWRLASNALAPTPYGLGWGGYMLYSAAWDAQDGEHFEWESYIPVYGVAHNIVGFFLPQNMVAELEERIIEDLANDRTPDADEVNRLFAAYGANGLHTTEDGYQQIPQEIRDLLGITSQGDLTLSVAQATSEILGDEAIRRADPEARVDTTATDERRTDTATDERRTDTTVVTDAGDEQDPERTRTDIRGATTRVTGDSVSLDEAGRAATGTAEAIGRVVLPREAERYMGTDFLNSNAGIALRGTFSGITNMGRGLLDRAREDDGTRQIVGWGAGLGLAFILGRTGIVENFIGSIPILGNLKGILAPVAIIGIAIWGGALTGRALGAENGDAAVQGATTSAGSHLPRRLPSISAQDMADASQIRIQGHAETMVSESVLIVVGNETFMIMQLDTNNATAAMAAQVIEVDADGPGADVAHQLVGQNHIIDGASNGIHIPTALLREAGLTTEMERDVTRHVPSGWDDGSDFVITRVSDDMDRIGLEAFTGPEQS